MFGTDMLTNILLKFFGDAGKEAVKKKMTGSIPKIVAGMTAKGMTLDKAAPDLVIRDALFRLWRSVIPSGDVADLVRDAQEEKIKPKVAARISGSATLTQVVEMARDEAIELAF
jgi:hypothetical protein